ncbi:MAG TPA: tRNA 2-thiouridine(34) synthase MnmA [Actinomycetota bacterium]|nr:tRNA 2-thiouridine(34) synthase MnmA [Actinomycetota bacterium]
MARLLAAMSGGVDSAVAAALAVREGHDVTGVTLKQWEHDHEESRLSKGCCTLDAVADARRAADVIGIPHYTLDFREIFEREVVAPFAAEYAAGRTPNPCVRCNEIVRFGALVDRAQALGFDALVTGHYARIAGGPHGLRLLRARAADKDQSYVLYALGQRALERARFPLGEMESKDRVRELATKLGLPNASREDSVEVCFVPEGAGPADVVAQRHPEAVRPGPVLDENGGTVGTHRGLANYTVGQRRGLGNVSGARKGATRPVYVSHLDRDRNAVVVTAAERLVRSSLTATRARWVSGVPDAGSRVSAVLRYRGERYPATCFADDAAFRLDFDKPARAVAPGQSAVLYDGDEVLGGGLIWSSA